MQRAALWSTVLGLVVMIHEPSALGQRTPASAVADESKRDEAVSHFTRGLDLAAGEHWDAALAEFVAAMGLYPLKNARKNAGRCLKQLGRFDEALAMWQSVLTEFETKLKPEEAAEANREIADLRHKVGALVVNANVGGAVVVVDGKERGRTPLPAPVLVSSGTRTVRVWKEGYVPLYAKPIIAGDRTVTLEATLVRLARSGRIQVVEETGRAVDVVIDGAIVGKTPTYEGAAAPGSHVVLLRGEGRLGSPPVSANVVVDQTTLLRLAAEDLRAAARIRPDPADAAVTLDGVPLGRGPWEGAVRAGTHRVDVSQDGYFASVKEFAALDGQTAVVAPKLERDEASPFWAKGRTYPFSLGLFGGVLAGTSLGSGYEASCASPGTDCYDRARPFGVLAGVRGAFEISPGLGIELEVGYAYVRFRNARTTTLTGDASQSIPVDISDTVTIKGALAAVFATYAFLRRPLNLTAALGAGVVVASMSESRTGAVATDASPALQPLEPSGTITVSKVIPAFMPEVRVGLPIGERVQVGLALAVVVGLTDFRPNVQQAPKDTSLHYNGPIGFLPHDTASGNESANAERAAGTFVLPHIGAFTRLAF
jgi:hypothetical protein